MHAKSSAFATASCKIPGCSPIFWNIKKRGITKINGMFFSKTGIAVFIAFKNYAFFAPVFDESLSDTCIEENYFEENVCHQV